MDKSEKKANKAIYLTPTHVLARYAPGTCHAGVVGVGDLGRSAMKKYLHIISAYLILVSPLISAESREKLTEEVMRAFQSRDLSVLANCKFVTIITGDVPLGREEFTTLSLMERSSFMELANSFTGYKGIDKKCLFIYCLDCSL